MIGSLRGKVTAVDPEGELLVEVAGVGYRVAVTTGTLSALGRTDNDIYLWVTQTVRDEVPRLFGFQTQDERHCFELLLKAQGIGPTLALQVLSHLPPDDLRRAVASDDPETLTIVPGVGKRTAERMMIDLKAKLNITTSFAATAAESSASTMAEVVDGLSGMGFSSQEIREALSQLSDVAADPQIDAAELMRQALRALSSRASS